MFISILGRQPEISLAELERVYGSKVVEYFSKSSALLDVESANIEKLGGSLKLGKVIETVPSTDWLVIEQHILRAFSNTSKASGKLTIGFSIYDFKIPIKAVEKTSFKLKNSLKSKGLSTRLVPIKSLELSTAASHHNKLGLSENKIELIVARGKDNQTIIASSVGAQNITAYAKRDQGRPKRDAFVGMLPPKLAQIMINLAVGDKTNQRILDPFCGTGVLLQEGLIFGHEVYGSDLSEKMIDYSKENLEWISDLKHLEPRYTLVQGDATTHLFKKPIDAIATESYLGQPFSAYPSPAKLKEVVGNCNHIIESFLKNIGGQIKPDTPLCVAIPAWKDNKGNLTHLPLTKNLPRLGYERIELKNVDSSRLAYYREDQVVARELLLIRKV